MLTVVVIAKNEEQMLPDCLRSVGFANEKIVIDNGSTDQTAAIAKKYKAKVIKTDLFGWDKLHNLGLEKATGDWIFYLDADERVSPQLKKQLLSAMQKSDFSAYEIKRQNIYLGKPMRYGGWGDDSVIRLFQKSALSGYKGNLHEQPQFRGKLGLLSASIIHYSHRDLYSMTEKTIIFTDYEAKNRLEAAHPPIVWWRFIRVMGTEFYHRFILLSAWRDGIEGIIDGLFQVFNSFIIYSRLWELQHEQKNSHL